MATKRGAGADPNATADMAKQAAPRKGARSAGEKKPAGSTRATKSTGAGATAERGSTSRGADGAKSAARSTGNGRARESSGGSKGGTGGTSRGGARKRTPDLKKDLRDFAVARPDGWSHDDWLRFLDDLQSRGHNINDRDAIGSMLERERLAIALERIPGVGPQRVKSIAEKYGYLWRLRETDADQLSREANVPKGVAEKVLQGLRH